MKIFIFQTFSYSSYSGSPPFYMLAITSGCSHFVLQLLFILFSQFLERMFLRFFLLLLSSFWNFTSFVLPLISSFIFFGQTSNVHSPTFPIHLWIISLSTQIRKPKKTKNFIAVNSPNSEKITQELWHNSRQSIPWSWHTRKRRFVT
jgi:hypothetical protein